MDSLIKRLQEAESGSNGRVLVCGGRDYTDTKAVCRVLDALHALRPIRYLIHGNARGADSEAGFWARSRGVQEIACPADWSKHGKRAGPIRNQNMLGHNPSLVIAFPGGAGTRDMVKRAKLAGVAVHEIAAEDSRPAESYRQLVSDVNRATETTMAEIHQKMMARPSLKPRRV